MESFEIALVSVFAMLALIWFGMHIAVVLMLISFIGVWVIKGSPVVATNLLWVAAGQTVHSFLFAVVPLFVFMGFLVSAAGMGRDTYAIGNLLLRRLRGGLGMATVAANAIFAAITGVSVASASVFSKLAVPEMLHHGYHRRFAVGTVAGSSVLGMLIPPSVLFIIYAIIVEQSVGDMFIAGIGPGLLLTAGYCIQIWVMCRWFPASVMADPAAFAADREEALKAERMSQRELWSKVLPIVALIVLVLGGLYGGVFTPVEAGAFGAFFALVFAVVRGTLTWRGLWEVLLDTGSVSATLLFLITAASMYSRMLGMSGLPTELAAIFRDMGADFIVMLAIYVAIVILLGMLIDSTSILLIMVPLFLAALKSYEIDLVWFGVVSVVATEIGLLTPPFGLAVYVVHATLQRKDISLKDIFAGSMPFALTMLIVLVVLIAWPPISTWLVHTKF
jgi:tripartite ATP-independent transporter DctM subunit